MVVFKSVIKRRSRDGRSTDSDNIPKRAKVHAQRKFAQGVAASNSVSHHKEKEKVKHCDDSPKTAELLPVERPKTEDFLTFLCFRGTSALPSRLGFFNNASSSNTNSSNPDSRLKIKRSPKVREKHSAVKILPNKFKKSSKTKTACRISERVSGRKIGRGRKIMEEKLMKRKQKALEVAKRSQRNRLISSVNQRRLITSERQRSGLRSGGNLPPNSADGLPSIRKPRSASIKKSKPKDPEPEITYPVRKSAPPILDSSDSEDDKSDRLSVMTTRTRSSSLKSHSSPAPSFKRLPSRKTKEAATVYMEMLNKDLRSPEEEDIMASDINNDQESKLTTKQNVEKKQPVKKSNKNVPVKKIVQKSSLREKSLKRNMVTTKRIKMEKRGLVLKKYKNIPKEVGDKMETRKTRSSLPSPPLRRELRKTRSKVLIDEDESFAEDESEDLEEEIPSPVSTLRKRKINKTSNINNSNCEVSMTPKNPRKKKSIKDDEENSKSEKTRNSLNSCTSLKKEEKADFSTNSNRITRQKDSYGKEKSESTNKPVKAESKQDTKVNLTRESRSKSKQSLTDNNELLDNSVEKEAAVKPKVTRNSRKVASSEKKENKDVSLEKPPVKEEKSEGKVPVKTSNANLVEDSKTTRPTRKKESIKLNQDSNIDKPVQPKATRSSQAKDVSSVVKDDLVSKVSQKNKGSDSSPSGERVVKKDHVSETPLLNKNLKKVSTRNNTRELTPSDECKLVVNTSLNKLSVTRDSSPESDNIQTRITRHNKRKDSLDLTEIQSGPRRSIRDSKNKEGKDESVSRKESLNVNDLKETVCGSRKFVRDSKSKEEKEDLDECSAKETSSASRKSIKESKSKEVKAESADLKKESLDESSTKEIPSKKVFRDSKNKEDKKDFDEFNIKETSITSRKFIKESKNKEVRAESTDLKRESLDERCTKEITSSKKFFRDSKSKEGKEDKIDIKRSLSDDNLEKQSGENSVKKLKAEEKLNDKSGNKTFVKPKKSLNKETESNSLSDPFTKEPTTNHDAVPKVSEGVSVKKSSKKSLKETNHVKNTFNENESTQKVSKEVKDINLPKAKSKNTCNNSVNERDEELGKKKIEDSKNCDSLNSTNKEVPMIKGKLNNLKDKSDCKTVSSDSLNIADLPKVDFIDAKGLKHRDSQKANKGNSDTTFNAQKESNKKQGASQDISNISKKVKKKNDENLSLNVSSNNISIGKQENSDASFHIEDANVDKSSNRRASVSSRLKSETSYYKDPNKSLLKRIVDIDSCLPNTSRRNRPKPRGRAKIKMKSSDDESSDSEELFTVRGSRTRNSFNGNKFNLPKKPSYLKSNEVSEKRPTRARNAKHSGSSFYYETDSSSHFSSSEEERLPKKVISDYPKKVEKIEEVDNSKSTANVSSNHKKYKSSHEKDTLKNTDIPDDLQDINIDFVQQPLNIDENPKNIVEICNSSNLEQKILIKEVDKTKFDPLPIPQALENNIVPAKSSIEGKSETDSLKDSDPKKATVASDSKNSEPIEQTEIKPKPKPTIGETWINAFKKAKIPKPGQLSPISHGVKPFVRKVYTTQPLLLKQNPPKIDSSDKKFKPFENLASNSASIISKKNIQSFQNLVSTPLTLVKPLKTSDQFSKEKLETSNVSFIKNKDLPNVQGEDKSKKFEPISIPKCPTDVPQKTFNNSIKDPNKKQTDDSKKTSEGKHQNLPLAVEHTLRKMSPVAVSRKPPITSIKVPPVNVESKELKVPPTPEPKDSIPLEHVAKVKSNPSSGSSWLWKSEKYISDTIVTKTSDIELMTKKKVNMTVEEINKWLNDSTSAGIEHTKDCGIFEKNQCECSFRSGGSNTQSIEDRKVGRSIVEPPVQLKDLEPKCTAETISACKVEEYKEKMISKSTVNNEVKVKTDIKKDPSTVNKPKIVSPLKQEKAWKSTRSMTEEEMCEFDFRFERNSVSPRDSGSEVSSPTMKEEVSSSNEDIGHLEKKSIFHKKTRTLSKSPCAFNAENESSVYAFEPDLPVVNGPFRRSGSKSNRGSEDDPTEGGSNSIAVQVNLEPEPVLECSTQTELAEDEEEGGSPTFYIPLQGRQAAEQSQVIQGVTVKLDTDDQEHRVIMRAKLVTKPPSNFTRPNPRGSSRSGKPEQKVRPLPNVSGVTTKPPVGAIQPTVRDEEPAGPSTKKQSVARDEEPGPSVKKPLTQGSTKQNSEKTSSSQPVKVKGGGPFPKVGMAPRMVEAPSFYPTEKEFQDPLDYIEKITPLAEKHGICRIVPPPSFRPECKVSDDMRFTAQNQYVHKMLQRWGPNVKEMTAIKKYLATQSIALTQPPWIGGIEIDLPRLYQTVQQCGGLKEVIEKKRWTRVADTMKIPKSAQDRVTKLDDIYCKYLLPYDTLSHGERNRLLDEVEAEWMDKERRAAIVDSSESEESDDGDSDDGMNECITKGRSMALSGFYRIARNTMWMWFGSDTNPPANEVENEYWKLVESRLAHVCVHSGCIDSGTWGYGFPITKTSSTSKHPWNLKVLTNNHGSILRSMGPLMGVTVPTLHVGMLFSTFCWYRDPHGLPWIDYLHTGASKIWYGVPDEWRHQLRYAVKSLLPSIVRDSPVWLPSDTAMVPPPRLLEKDVSLCRIVQEPGQFIVVFPKAYTSSICTGYLVSESVYFAPSNWLNSARQIFKETRESCEPTMFSLEKLLFSIANDARAPLNVLSMVLPMVEIVRSTEVKERRELERLGLKATEKLPKSMRRPSKSEEEHECNHCRTTLFLSFVTNTQDDVKYCLSDAIDFITKDADQLKYCKLLYSYDEEELEELIEKIKKKIEIKQQKKNSSKSVAGGSTKAEGKVSL